MSFEFKDVRAVLELLYFLSGVGLLFVGCYALRQIKIAKDDVATRVSREAARETVNQLDLWAKEVIPSVNQLWEEYEKAGYKTRPVPMERFDLDELSERDLPDRQHQQKFLDLLEQKPEFKAKTLNACNMVEASAMSFMTGVANEEFAFMPLSGPFCAFVERSFALYCGMRHKDKLNPWDYTIRLYRVWSQRRRKFEINSQQEELSKEWLKATRESKPVRPLGA